MIKSKTHLPAKIESAKLVPWHKVSPLSVFKLEKDSRAGVILDKDGAPQLFIFDTSALLDVLSTIDEALVDKLSTSDYHSKKTNPAGWLIDEIESKLPLKPKFIESLKKALQEARKKGWVPFSKIKNELGLI